MSARNPNENRPAESSDRGTRPMPDKHTLISLDRRFTAQQMQRIRTGLLPRQMEDKWFIYWSDGRLCFHRSWTGSCIYVARFSREHARPMQHWPRSRASATG